MNPYEQWQLDHYNNILQERADNQQEDEDSYSERKCREQAELELIHDAEKI